MTRNPVRVDQLSGVLPMSRGVGGDPSRRRAARHLANAPVASTGALSSTSDSARRHCRPRKATTSCDAAALHPPSLLAIASHTLLADTSRDGFHVMRVCYKLVA